MNDERDPDPTLVRWYVLPSLDAHRSRLPPAYAGRSMRAVRVASAALMRTLGCAPSRAQIQRLHDAGFQTHPQAWRQLSLEAGARYFSSALRRATGSALSAQLAAELGPARWRACLVWVDAGLDAVTSLPGAGAGAGDVVACAGAELLLAQMGDVGPALKQRLHLRSAPADVQCCMALRPPAESAECRRIADAVLGRGRE